MSEETYCECEFCPGHQVEEPMPMIYCTTCKDTIPTGNPLGPNYFSYGWDEEKSAMVFQCGKCHKEKQIVKKKRAKK